mmetsp:Transcript_46061/g.128136  ORF Transcript_46061/g.128136 Transcript_46061/m.128136 type:complete len:96 (-) Transcript_46061:2528-2815(-)
MSYSWCYADDDLPLIIPNAVMFIPPAAAAAIPARLGLLMLLVMLDILGILMTVVGIPMPLPPIMLVCNPMLVGIPIIAFIIGPPPMSAAPGVPPL